MQKPLRKVKSENAVNQHQGGELLCSRLCYCYFIEKKDESHHFINSHYFGCYNTSNLFSLSLSGFDSGSLCRSWVVTSAVGNVVLIVLSVVSGIGGSDACVSVTVGCTN